MAIKNEVVVDSTSKYIVKSTGIGSETGRTDDGNMIEASKGKFGAEFLSGGNTDSLVSLIECYFIIESVGLTTGKLVIDVVAPATEGGFKKMTLTNSGKYGLRPEQLKFGNDKQFTLTTDENVKSYLLVTEFRRN